MGNKIFFDGGIYNETSSDKIFFDGGIYNESAAVTPPETFNLENLNGARSANSSAGVLFTYKAAATLADIRAASYFDAAEVADLRDGDLIMVVGSDGYGFNRVVVTGTVYTLTDAITSS